MKEEGITSTSFSLYSNFFLVAAKKNICSKDSNLRDGLVLSEGERGETRKWIAGRRREKWKEEGDTGEERLKNQKSHLPSNSGVEAEVHFHLEVAVECSTKGVLG
jgi:hypothetical protein